MDSKLRRFAVLALAVMAGACGGLVGPDGTGNVLPGQVYEQLPASHPILDETGGETKMRVELAAEPIPARGSVVKMGSPIGPPDCSKGECWMANIRMFFDGTPNPNKGARFTGWFAEDEKGERKCGGGIFAISVGPLNHGNQPVMYGNDGLYTFFPVGCIPRYLFFEAEFRGDVNGTYGTIPGEAGKTSFLLDYKVQ